IGARSANAALRGNRVKDTLFHQQTARPYPASISIVLYYCILCNTVFITYLLIALHPGMWSECSSALFSVSSITAILFTYGATFLRDYHDDLHSTTFQHLTHDVHIIITTKQISEIP